MTEWAFAIPDAENTVRIMQEAPAKRPRKPFTDIVEFRDGSECEETMKKSL